MAPYKLYFINPAPKHIRDIVEFDAEDDRAAMRHATQLSDGRATELWQFDRVVDARAERSAVRGQEPTEPAPVTFLSPRCRSPQWRRLQPPDVRPHVRRPHAR
jgi:hypothetical protein